MIPVHDSDTVIQNRVKRARVHSMDHRKDLAKVAKSPQDLLKGINGLVVSYAKDTNAANLFSIIEDKRVNWKNIANGILDEKSAANSIFKQELQKRRRLRAKANILKQSSIKSLGRRGACLKTDSDGESDVYKLFEHVKSDIIRKKIQGSMKPCYTKVMINENEFESYNFTQASSKVRPVLKKTFKNSSLLKLHSETAGLRQRGIELKNLFTQKNQGFKRFMRSILKSKKSKNKVRSRYLRKNTNLETPMTMQTMSSCKRLATSSSNRAKTSASTKRRSGRKTSNNLLRFSKRVKRRALINSREYVYKKPDKSLFPDYDSFLDFGCKKISQFGQVKPEKKAKLNNFM
ncbi:unnamed protein product [Moneuplotes crassus]|uniref:Uncharacterized protein n=1 Tax=Euplotes crassus TaxID=5936 RepID=A0AAD1XHB3_EUPCR|nr:unnamed protein product [Moneuplotes crassus]